MFIYYIRNTFHISNILPFFYCYLLTCISNAYSFANIKFIFTAHGYHNLSCIYYTTFQSI